MSDLIDRQAAIDAIESHLRTAEEPYYLHDTDKIMNHAFEVAASCVYNLPSAQSLDPCETCLHKGKGWDEDPRDGCTGTESKYEPMVSPDGTLIVNVPKGTKVKRVIVLPYAD